MSVRGLFAAFIVATGVEASLILPMVSQAQLAETVTASSIQGQVATMQKSNLLTPGRKARAMAGKANQDRLWESQVLNESRGEASKGVDAANVQPFDETKPVKGCSYMTDGIVVKDGLFQGQRLVFVVKIQAANRFQVMGFRLHDPSLPPFAENTPVRVTAMYAAKVREPETGTWVHGFDNAVFESGQVASSQPQGSQGTAQEAEKPTFASLMKGWEFRGTVKSDGRSTGVFVNGELVKYAQAGTVLEEGVQVSGFEDGSASVVVDGRRMDVTPW